MKKIIGMLCLLVGLAACAVPPTAAPPTQTPVAKSGTFRVGFTSNADFGDLPTLMALDRLQEEGYTIQTQFFSGADLEVAALTKGDLDMGNGSTRTHWNAIAKGAPIVTIMEEAADDWSLFADNRIKACADLNGKRVAYSSAGALNAALLSAYLDQNCAGTKPDILSIADSGARAQALVAGDLDATPLELADVLFVQQTAGDKFHPLVNFAATLPKLKTTGLHIRTDFAKQNPVQAHDYIRMLLTVEREIHANPKLVEDAAVKYLKLDSVEAERAANAYVQNNIWDVNGGLSQDAVAYSVDFFTNTGSLTKGLTAAKVSDLDYLNAVLDEIGRK